MNFYFYDLETSGFSARFDRIMQFAGQRTDEQLKPIGKPDNFLIKLTPDVLPQPDAVLVHGITPQKTRAEGKSEAKFLAYFADKVVRPNTVFVGFNNIRFDDEFMRFMLWRNFYDAYEWHWKNSSSRWDLIDVARMTRALRPDGIEWPYTSDGKPTVGLERLASANNLEHDSAHDALSDVRASIAVARLLRLKQPKLFNYLLNLRSKEKVSSLLKEGKPVLYTSGRYPSEYLKTTVVAAVGETDGSPGAFMYDLRIDPTPFIKLSPDELVQRWTARGEKAEYFPVKKLTYNKCPAIAPLSVLDKASQERLKINMGDIEQNFKKLMQLKNFADNLNQALKLIYGPDQPQLMVDDQTVDARLYDGFVNGPDKTKMSVVRATDETSLPNLDLEFDDERLNFLLPLYKARNFPNSLNSKEEIDWLKFCRARLTAGGKNSQTATYQRRLKELSDKAGATNEQKALLKELESYGESILKA